MMVDMRRLLSLVLALSAIGAAQGPPPAQPTQLVTSRLWVLPATPAPEQVPFANVQISGSRGNATYFYWIVSKYLIANSIPAGPFAVTNAPNTLNGSNFDVVSFQPVSDSGVTYDVLRTTTPVQPSGVCNCAVATAVSGGPVNDQSNSLNAYTVATLDPNTLNFTLTNEVQGAGSAHLILRQNGVQIADLSTAAGGGPFVKLNPTSSQNITGAFPLFLSDPGAALGIGTTTIAAGNQLEIDSNVQAQASILSHATGLPSPPVGVPAGPPFLILGFSRGTEASPAAVQGNSQAGGGVDPLGALAFAGFDGSVYFLGADVAGIALENWTPTTHGSAISVYTTQIGSINPFEVFRFGQGTKNQSNLDLVATNPKTIGWVNISGVIDAAFSREGAGIVDVGRTNTQGDTSGFIHEAGATLALSTSAIGAHTCSAAQTATITGLTTSAVVKWSFATTPIGVTGYGDATTPFLVVTTFPTTNTGNVVVCNISGASITPGAISVNLRAEL